MDSKRVYKKISSIFWFLLATFPLWFSAIGSLLMYFLHFDNNIAFNALDATQGSESIFKLGSSSFTYLLRQIVGNNVCLGAFTPVFIRGMFNDLFHNGFGINYTDSMVQALSNCFAWFCWVYIIEIMVDVFIWLPRWMHSLLEKGVGKID